MDTLLKDHTFNQVDLMNSIIPDSSKVEWGNRLTKCCPPPISTFQNGTNSVDHAKAAVFSRVVLEPNTVSDTEPNCGPVKTLSKLR
jgi:hypothetical protein